MKYSRIFRGDFKDHAAGEFVTTRGLTVNGERLEPDTPFDKDSVSGRTLRLLYENRKIKPADSAAKPQEGTKESDTEAVSDAPSAESETPVSEPINSRKATIVEGGAGWLKVVDENGEKVGNSTRDEEEAELIKLAYEAGEPLPE